MMLMNTTIKKFHEDHYGSTINKLSFRLPYVTILGSNNCGKKDVDILKEGTGWWTPRASMIIIRIFVFSFLTK